MKKAPFQVFQGVAVDLRRFAGDVHARISARRVPTRLQYQTTECGVAVLAMILAYHGRHVSLEELRRVTGVSRDCLNGEDIIRAARHYGVDCVSYKGEPKALRKLSFPFVAHLNFIHFVVVEGMTSTHVLVNDPGHGRGEIPMEVFNEIFTGVTMTFHPGDGFEPGGERERPAREAWRRMDGGSKALIGAAVLLACLLAANLLGLAWALGETLAAPIGGTPPSRVTIAMLGVLIPCQGALSVAMAVVLERVRARVSGRMVGSLLDRLMRRPFDYLAYRLPWEQARSIQDCDRMARLASHELLPTLLTLPAGLVLLAGLWRLDAGLAALAAALLVLTVVALSAAAVWRAGLERAVAPGRGSVGLDVFRDAMTIETVKFAGLDRDFIASRMGRQAIEAERAQHNALARLAGWVIARLSGLALVFATASLAALAWAEGRMDTAGLVSAVFLSFALEHLTRRWSRARGKVGAARALLFRHHDLLSGPREGGKSSPSSPIPGAGDFGVRAIVLGHSPWRPPLMKGADFAFRAAGEQVGLTGPSGGGKSTFAKVAAGLYAPWSGAVTGDRRVQWIDKTPVLFEGTVRENLLLWRDGVDDRTLWAALRDACLDEVIRARPGGLDAPVLARGRNFSGGQGQRLEIARALTQAPDILILDEALDGLDPDLEARLRATLRARGLSVLIVSHRASTLEACDRILHFHGGGLHDAPPTSVIPEPRYGGMEDRFHGTGRGEGRPTPAASDTGEEPSLYGRKVRFLRKHHWRWAHLTLLGQRLSDGKLVTLNPLRDGYGVDGQGIRARPDTIAPGALCAYAPAALEAKTPRALFRAWAKGGLGDLTGALGLPLIAALVLLLGVALASWPLFGGDDVSAWKIGVSIVGGLAIIGLMEASGAISALRLASRMEFAAKSDLFQRFVQMRAEVFGATPRAVLARAFTTHHHLSRRLGRDGVEGARGVALHGMAVLALGFLDPVLAGLVVMLSGALVATRWGVAGVATGARRVLDGRGLVADRFLYTMVEGLARLRVAGAEAHATAHWRDLNGAWLKASSRARLIDEGGRVAGDLWLWTGLATVTLVAGASPEAPLAEILLAWVGLDAAGRIGEVVAGLRRAFGSLDGLRLLLGAPMDPSGGVPARPAAIAAEGVAFRYDTAPHRVLDGVSFSLNPGEITALVGPSGSGKSTLLRLLLGLETPTRGRILIDGHPLEETDSRRWRGTVGVVQQGDYLDRSATLRGHIAGLAPLGVEAVWWAADLAELSDDIHAMPMGMRTIVEHGKLSTGQEQRLLIARQLLRRPDLLVLDEATNAIPEDIQARILANLRAEGIGCVLATHRESAIAAADRVLMLRDGRLVWSGPPSAFAEQDAFLDLIRRERLVEVVG